MKFLYALFVFLAIHAVANAQNTYYWVGGSGVWNDLSHWATTSGGAINYTIVPSVLDDVVFDANSFTGAGQSVTLNQEAFCMDFKWDNVSNTPTFTGAGYTLNVGGDFIALGTPYTFNHLNGNLIISGDYLVDGANMTFTKNGGTFTIGGQFDIQNVTGMSFSRNSTMLVSGGGMTFTNATLSSFTAVGITITTGNLSFSNAKTTGTFSSGTITLNNGGISIPGWSGGNFTTSTINMTGNFTLSGWTSGSLTTGNITSSAGNLSVSNWAAGTFSVGTITLSNGGITVADWSGGNFSTSNISFASNLSFNNWTSGTLAMGTISSASGSVSIDNKTAGNTTISALSLTNGNFELTNSAGLTLTVSSTSTVGGNFLIDTAPMVFQMGSGTTLTVNGNFSILNGASTFTHNGALNVRGNFTLNSACAFNQTGTVIFTATTAGKTITSAGKSFTNVRFNGSGGEWILQDNFKATGATDHYTGAFRSNGKSVDYGLTFNGDDNGTVRTLDYTGSDTVRAQYSFRVNPNANTVLTTGGAVLLLRTSSLLDIVLEGGGKTFGTVVVNHLNTANSTYNIYFYDVNTAYGDVYLTINNLSRFYSVNGNNTYGNVSIYYGNTSANNTGQNYIAGANTFGNFSIATAGPNPQWYCDNNNTFAQVSLPAGATWQIAAGRTQSLTGLTATGNCLKTVYIYSPSSSATITDTDGGTNTLDFVRLDRIAFTGATWTATNTLDAANTTGIAAMPPTGQTYYWIGGAGNWNDPTKWSLSSGGSAAGCLPTRIDNVVFDNNSFPGSNQTVTLNVAGEVVDMTWTAGVNASPNFAGSQSMIIDGDLTVAGAMDWQLTGALTLRQSIVLNSAMTWANNNTVTFSGTTTGNTIDMAGKTFTREVYFDNPGSTASGAWTLAANFAVSPSYYTIFRDATFVSAGYAVDFGAYLTATDNVPKILDFTGTDTVRVQREWRMLAGSNATLTMGNAVLLLRQPSGTASDMYVYGGGKTYQDAVIEAQHSSTAYNIYLYDNATACRDIYVRISGQENLYWQNAYASRDVYVNYLSSSTAYTPIFQVSGNHTMNSLRFTSPSVQARLYLNNSNAIDTLQLHHGMDAYFGAGQTQTLEALIANGTCTRMIDLFSTSTGTFANLTDAADANNLDFVNLRDIQALGAATWTAANVLDVSNTVGITVTTLTAQTYYWIGGAGNWDDPTKWSLSSGGAPAGCTPTKVDDVVFDNNSFPGANQTVTLNVAAEVVNMIWTAGVNASPNFSGSQALTINGNLTVAGNMDWLLTSVLTLRQSIVLNGAMTWSQGNTVIFSGTTSGNTINMAGKTFIRDVIFNNPGNTADGGWTLASDFSVSLSYYTYFYDATFVSNGYGVQFGDYLYAQDNLPKVLDFTGTDTVRVQREWRMLAGANATLTMGTAVLLFRQSSALTGSMNFYGGGKTYHDVVIEAQHTTSNYTISLYDNATVCRDIYFKISGQQIVAWQNAYNSRDVYVNYLNTNTAYTPNFQVSGNHAMNSLRFASPSVQARLYLYNSNAIDTLQLYHGMDAYFGAGQTQTLEALIANGTCTRLIDLFSTTTGTLTNLTDAAGTNNIDFVNLRDIRAQGGATWNASNVLSNINNVGWNIVGAMPITYYWIGGTGNWTDPLHWSLSSGGGPAGCVPGTQDDVVFDVNSFTGIGQAVNITGATTCRNMTWTSGVTLNPTFQGNFVMDIQGDLQVSGTMTWIQNSTLYARGDFRLSNSATWSHTTVVNFYSDSTNNVVNTAGKTFLQAVVFDAQTTGSGPKWTLASDFKVSTSYSISVVEGSFITAGYEVDAGNEFLANSGTDLRTIDLSGTDTLRARTNWRITSNVNTTFVAGAATILLETNANTSLIFDGGNRTYSDVVVRYASASSTTYDITFNGNNNIRDLYVRTYTATGIRRIYFNNSEIFRNVDIDHYGSAQVQVYFATGPHTFNNFVVETLGTGIAYLDMNCNNTFNTLDLPNGFDMLIYASRTQTTASFIPRSACLKRSTIRGNNSSTSRISQASGTVSTEWITLQNHTVLGGATFSATDATISGTVTGWTYLTVQPITMYWVGGTGNWNDANHWAFTSGGPGNGCIIPKSTDNVVFDAASFTAGSQTVTLNATATVVNMIWSNVAFTPTFGGSSQLTVSGNLFVNSAMNWTQSGVLILNGSVTLFSGMSWNHNAATNFTPLAGNYTLDFAGKSFISTVTFNGNANAVWMLASNFSAATGVTTNFQQGKFYSNGYELDFGYALNFNVATAKLLDFTGTDTVRVRREWYANATGTTLNMGGAVLLLQTNQDEDQYFRGGNLTYNELVVRHLHANARLITFEGNNTLGAVGVSFAARKDITMNGNSSIGDFTLTMDHSNTGSIPVFQLNGSNSFLNFVLLSLNLQGPEIRFNQNNTFGNFISVGRNTRLLFGASRTQTFTGDVQILGTGSTPILMNSTTTGTQATLSKATGELCFDYVWIRDINATGGATYNAGLNGINLGNNTGITFGNSCIAYYWVGDSGNWSDYANHWATASGGSIFHLQAPTPTDNVVFDANSFTLTGQTVTLDVVGECRDMTWLSALFNPTLAGPAADLNIYGGLVLSPYMNQNWTGTWNFLADDGNAHTVNTQGKTLTDMDVNASTGSTILLANNLTLANSINLSGGNLSSQGKNIQTKEFNLLGTATRNLNLGASDVTVTDGKWDVQDATNLTITAGTSEIILQSEGGASNFFGGSQTYNNARFYTASAMSGSITGSNTFNTLTVEPGVTLSLASGSTQATTNLVATGTCSKGLTINATVAGSPATFSQASGTVNANFIALKDNTATGGATFNANQATDQGNNTGWNFPSTAALDVTINKTDPTCPTPNNGSVTAVVSGGVAPFSYKWNTLSTLSTLNNLSQGSYSVTVTDAAGCTGTASTTLTQPASYNFATTTTGETICFGAADGDVSVSAPTAQTPIAYTWSNGATTAMVGNLTAGTYSVTLVDAANCRAFNSATVSSRPDINAGSSITTSKCIDAPTGFSATGTGSGLMYGWDFGDSQTGSGQSVSHTYTVAGDYLVAVTVTDVNGCEDVVNTPLTIAPALSLSANVVDVSSCTPNTCNGQVILLPSGGLAPFQFSGPEFAHAFYGTTISTTLFNRDNNSGAYAQNDELSVTGNSSWNKRIYTSATFARAAGKEFYCKYYHPAGGAAMIGWHGNSTGNTANTYLDLIYALYFANASLTVYQDGSSSSTVTASVPGGYSTNTWYEVRIVLKATGADYYLRKMGVGNYVLLYSGTFSSETNLRLGMSVNTGTAITDDWTVTGASPVTTSLCPGDYTYTVADANGCTDSHTATVDITDITPPVANCQNITVSLDNMGEYTLSPSQVDNNSLDDCGIDGMTLDATSFDCGDIGANTVELTVTDQSNNTATCSATVMVADQSAPVVTCPPTTTTIPVNPGSPCTISIPDYVDALNPTDNCTASGGIVEAQDITAGSYPVGGDGAVVVVNYTATDAATPANTRTCTVTITVSAAEIDVQGNSTSIVNGDNSPSAADHTDFGQFSGTPITRTFTIFNTGSQDLTLGAGAITLSGMDAALFAVDNVVLPAVVNGPGGSLSFDVTYSPGVYLGQHTATVQIASDDCDEGAYEFAIQGEFTCVAPSFSACPAAPVAANTGSGQCMASVSYLVVADGTPAPALTYDFGGATTGSGGGMGSGETFNKGNTTVTVTAANTCGTETCVFAVTVTDNQPPTAVCQDITVQLNANGAASILAEAVDNGSNDACGLSSLSLDLSDFDCDDVSDGTALNNYAIDIDGVNDWIDATGAGGAKASAASLGLPVQAITLECWVKPRTYGVWKSMVAFLQDNGSFERGWDLETRNGGKFGFALNSVGGGGSLTYMETTNSFSTNTWYHIAGVYDGTTMKIYVNGVLENTSTAENGNIWYADSWLAIGMYKDDNEAYSIDAGLDEIRIWNIARTQAEILSTMNATLTGNESGLVAYYPFEDGPGSSTVTDLSSYGQDGILKNMDPSTDWIAGSPANGGNSGVVVTLTATDNNSNTASCTATVTVQDNLPPAIVCPAGPSVSPTSNSPCSAVVSGIDAAVTESCPYTLTYSFSGATAGSGNGQASGQAFNAGVTTVTYTATENSGAQAATSCMFTVTVGQCDLHFSGTILWDNPPHTGVKDATVNLSGAGAGSSLSDVNGDFMVSIPYATGNFTVKPVKNINRLNGVTVADAMAIQQHIASINPITDPYKLIAADVNRSNSISTLDALLINQCLLNSAAANAIFSVFWRFVPQTWPLVLPPWGFPEHISLTGVSSNQSGLDFYGVKIGDVVSTWANPANFGPSGASGLVLVAPDQTLEAGAEFSTDIRAEQTEDLAALQFALGFDPGRLELLSAEPVAGGLPIRDDNIGLSGRADGEMRVVWSQTTGLALSDRTPVLRLRWRALQGGARLSEVLHLEEDALRALAYTSALAESGVELRFEQSTAAGQPAAATGLQLLQNRPNPFGQTTRIEFVLPDACDAQLRIFDAAGKLLWQSDGAYPAGLNGETLRLDRLTAAGVLYYELTTPFGTLTKRMVRMEN